MDTIINFPTLPADFYECMGALAFALLLGKLMHAETRVLTASLIGALVTNSYAGIIGAVILCTIFQIASFINLGD